LTWYFLLIDKQTPFLVFSVKINLSSILQWKINVFLYKRLSWKIAFFYIYILGNLFFSLNKKERWKIESAIHTVFSDRKNDTEINAVLRNVFRGILSHYYEKLFNAFSSVEILKAFLNMSIKSQDMAAIRQGLSNGKGVLLVTGHFGGIEFIPAFLAAKSCPVTIIARFSSDLLRDASIQKAKKFSTRIIDADNTPNIIKAVFNNLKENRIVITQCDEIEEWRPSRNKKLFFLGKQINLDKTIDILLKRCGTSIVFCLMHRDNNYGYRFIAHSFEEEEHVLSPENLTIGARILKMLEKYIYEYPEQWYQWKKYSDMEMITPDDIKMGRTSSLPILRTSLRKAA
jgi:KDO2-lipid IV(A) lauroyltransferase